MHPWGKVLAISFVPAALPLTDERLKALHIYTSTSRGGWLVIIIELK